MLIFIVNFEKYFKFDTNFKCNVMKKIYSLFLMIFTFFTLSAQDAGIFESYAVLNINNAGNTYYDLQATTGNPDFNGANLGSFSNTESLVVSGGEIKTWKNNGGDVTGAKMYFRVYTGSSSSLPFTEVDLPWVQNISSSDQKWTTTSNTTNVLSGLDPGTYTLEVYYVAFTNVGNRYSNNGGSNYKATFTITTTLGTQENALKNKSYVIAGKLYSPKQENLNVQVVDFSGRVIKTMNVKSSSNGVELNLTKRGNYILKVNDEVIKFAY